MWLSVLIEILQIGVSTTTISVDELTILVSATIVSFFRSRDKKYWVFQNLINSKQVYSTEDLILSFQTQFLLF